MVSSQDMAMLISHADQAGAKLVLIGDPAQLDAIEAGGLFSAIAERTDPVVLDEVIRHNFDLDRDAVKRIREGEGAQALSLYRSEERVTVAPDAKARREAMVSDWLDSYSNGDDALMVAKTKAEVQRLNAAARKLLREEGMLGEQEIVVGDSPFAAGDQVITRVNDHANHIYNRERWQVVEVDPDEGTVVLHGVDRPRTVEVGPAYLAQTTLGGEVPALQHAYAVTTYCAQGATVDRAFVMADPSMDRQELYVATSRSREETYLYATAEVDVGREEFAPASYGDRGALAQLAQAAERDRAQSAAHDVARFESLPSAELARRREELFAQATTESSRERMREQIGRAVAQSEAALAEARERVNRALEAGDPRALSFARGSERNASERLAYRRGELAKIPEPTTVAREELQALERVLGQRLDRVLTAARISPPPYIAKELGARPADPAKAAAWDSGARGIEGYRHKYGVTDRKSALGKDVKEIGQRAARRTAERRVQEAQRRLGRERQHGRERGFLRERTRSLGR